MYDIHKPNALDISNQCLYIIHQFIVSSFSTRQSTHFHVPLKRDVNKTCLSYRGDVIWNGISKCDIKLMKVCFL